MGSKHGECAICGAELDSEPKHFLNCNKDLDQTHGKDCDCWLPVGSGCWKKFKSNTGGKTRHEIDELVKGGD